MVVDYINARIRPISSPYFMSLVQGSIAVSKTADVGAKPTGHVSMTKSWIAIIGKRKL